MGVCGSMWESCGCHAFVKEAILKRHRQKSTTILTVDEARLEIWQQFFRFEMPGEPRVDKSLEDLAQARHLGTGQV